MNPDTDTPETLYTRTVVVQCRAIYNEPHRGFMTLYNVETDAIVAIEKMTNSETPATENSIPEDVEEEISESELDAVLDEISDPASEQHLNWLRLTNI